MSKLPPSDEELMDRQVRASESYFRNLKKLAIPKAAKCLGMCVATYKNRMERPEIITLEDFREFVRFYKIPDDQILRMIRPER